MKRETILAIVLAALLTAVPMMIAQDQGDDQGRPAPPAPSDVIGTQLIAWSELQEPQPVSARTPPSDQTKLSQPNQQPVQTANSSKEQAPAPDSSVSQNVKNPKK